MGEKKDNLSGPIFHAQKSIQGEKYNKFALCVIPVRYNYIGRGAWVRAIPVIYTCMGQS